MASEIKCSHCAGTGSYSGMSGGTGIGDECRNCGGTGKVSTTEEATFIETLRDQLAAAEAEVTAWANSSLEHAAKLNAENAELRATAERNERNHDMWKGQCERQAVHLTAMRAALSDLHAHLFGPDTGKSRSEIDDACRAVLGKHEVAS